jgi:hypothetical protein
MHRAVAIATGLRAALSTAESAEPAEPAKLAEAAGSAGRQSAEERHATPRACYAATPRRVVIASGAAERFFEAAAPA